MKHTFTHASGSFTFSRHPQRPRLALQLEQAGTVTASGLAYGYDPPIAHELIAPLCPAMSAAELALLRVFFNDVANGMAETFTWSDLAGVDTTVRFAKPELIATETATGTYAVTIALLRA